MAGKRANSVSSDSGSDSDASTTAKSAKKPAAPKKATAATKKQTAVSTKKPAAPKKAAKRKTADDNDEDAEKEEEEEAEPLTKQKAREQLEKDKLVVVEDEPERAKETNRKKKHKVVLTGFETDESEEEEQAPASSWKKGAKDMKHSTLNFGGSSISEGRSKISRRADDALDLRLPPMNNIHQIFAHLTKGFAGELAPVMKELKRPLRVATMCSGTESPILAMRLIFRHLEQQTGVKASMHHVFSAEIEPYKQAYIERNFAPPILFRDVTELPNDQARTAYGAMVDVPGDCDILIAGTSCVDYSNLNVAQQGINDGGESSRTFYGMLQWVERHEPPIVILENVQNAPWEDGILAFDDIGYSAFAVKNLDTKKYYIPHTRQRGYLVAFPKKDRTKVEGKNPKPRKVEDVETAKKKAKKSKKTTKAAFWAPDHHWTGKSTERLAHEWAARVEKAARPASAPTEAFLLNSDDPRIHRARQELSHVKLKQDGTKRSPADWIKCEQRHAFARHDERLGKQKPLTDWQDAGGKPTMPDGAWQDWAEAQTERVLDLMDISFLRQAKMGVDITYKSAIWNLSQNVDRTTASKLYGITPCLTPNMIPYLTNRGGPVVGVEALALQGLPIDELLLTRENTDQLANLAGNAMSSTVVGTAIAAALVVAGRTLLNRKYGDADAEMDDSPALSEEVLESRFRGSERLVEHPVDLASVKPTPSNLLQRALSSARKCTCEGRQGVSNDPIVVCTACGHSSCTAHDGKPKHKYEADEAQREDPNAFEVDLKEYLPMRLALDGLTAEGLEKLSEEVEAKGADVDGSMSERYLEVVQNAVEGEFHYHRIDRRETWVVVYTNAYKARIELEFQPHGYEWRVYATPPKDLNMRDALRAQLEHPVARMKLAADSTDILSGKWEFKLPLATSDDNKAGGKRHKSADGDVDMADGRKGSKQARVKLEFPDRFVKSWRATLELEEFAEEQRPSEIKVTLDGDAELLDRPIDGTYVLEPDCGTASNSLYRLVDSAQSSPLYFFYDPSPYLQEEHDSFVFAENCSRPDGRVRPLIAKLKPTWRLPDSLQQGESAQYKSPEVILSQTWAPVESVKIAANGPLTGGESQFSTIKTGFELAIGHDKCGQAEDLLFANVPLANSPSDVWAKEEWHEVDLQHEGPEVFAKLAWMVSRIPDWQNLKEWQAVECSTIPDHICESCAPTMPSAEWIRRWMLTGGSTPKWRNQVFAREQGLASASYEIALKHRPSAIVVHTRHKAEAFELRVGLNVVSLAHRVLAQLPTASKDRYEREDPAVEWRLSTIPSVALGRQSDHTFTLKHNRDDPEAESPRCFKSFKLRPEQRRSLHWMIEQEENPTPWVEEEVAEALLPQLGWLAEAKATREAVIRGGVVADAVGYGKTAITLGLIASRLEEDADLPEEDDRIPIKATLIIVPAHLNKQWPSEVDKFCGAKLSYMSITSMADLKKKTIEHFREVNIVFVSETVFKSAIFWPQLADFSGAQEDIKADVTGKKATRYFRHTVEKALDALGRQIQRLETKGSRAVSKHINKARDGRSDALESEDFIPPTRAKANAEALAAGKKPVAAPPKPDPTERVKGQIVSDKDWALTSDEVIRDYNNMKSPLLTMFSYARLVIDEFSYTAGTALAGVQAIRARSRWILSGTPPLDDFSHIKSIADLLHVHLGVDDDNEGTHSSVKIRREERTKAEEFRSYCDVRTRAWHARRDMVAQRFLDQFARQNVAEIDEIKMERELLGVRLPGAEMAIYRELEHHLFAVDPNLAKIARIKTENLGDRDRRLREALGQSKTPQEALLKRCSHFSLDLPASKLKDGLAPHVTEYICEIRDKQLAHCLEQVKKQIAGAAYKHRKAEKLGYYKERVLDNKSFQDWVEQLDKDGFGDVEANEQIKKLAELAGCEKGNILRSEHASTKPTLDQVKFFNEPYNPKDVWEDYVADRTLDIRTDCAHLRTLCKELVGRTRSKRYFDAVQVVLTGDRAEEGEGHVILSCCGHQGLEQEVRKMAQTNKCIVPSCGATVNAHNILSGNDLGSDRTSGHFGYKLETLVTLIKETPLDERVLVFVQFDDLYAKVQECLEDYGIDTMVLKGSAKQKSELLQQFQDPNSDDTKVLLLLATDQSASGANLTVANHAFFVSPLLTETKSHYKSLSTQAIGRIHRFGQLKTANVYHLLTHGTLDMRTFAERNGYTQEKDDEQQQAERLVPHLSEREIEVPRDRKKKKSAELEARREKERLAQQAKAEKAEERKRQKAEASGKGKIQETDDKDEESEMAAEVSEAAEEVSAVKGKGKAGAVSPPAKAKGNGKSKVVVLSDEEDSDQEEEENEEEEEEEEVGDEESETEDDDQSVHIGNDDDDFGADIDLTADDTPRKRNLQPRRSTTTAAPKYAAESEEEEGEEAGESEVEEAAPTKKKRRIIADSDDEDSEPESEPAASTLITKASGRPSSAKGPPLKKRKSEFIGVVIARSPAKSPRKAIAKKVVPASPVASPSRSAASSSGSAAKSAEPIMTSTDNSREPSLLLADGVSPDKEAEMAVETPGTEFDRELGMEVDDEEEE
ncbi:hypothetical protein JCM11641_001296 [Rhodosporidiobolus odoratus]